MNLAQALRLPPASSVAFVGAGGKSTALFQLARELNPPVIITATTHLGAWQIPLADKHIVANLPASLAMLEHNLSGVMLVTGEIKDNKTEPVNAKILSWLREVCKNNSFPILIEADGSRQKPLKAPAEHEPVIPEFIDLVVQVVGLAGLGKTLNNGIVHRYKIFGNLVGFKMGETITPEALTRVLTHPKGGLKNIPAAARRVALLNQADTPELQAQADTIAKKLLSVYHSVIVASLKKEQIHAVHEPIAGIILAAGESTRFGQPKQLLNWRGESFVRAVAKSALEAGLSPVIVVTGSHASEVASALDKLPVQIVQNEAWQSGQATSIRAGLGPLRRSAPPSPFSVGKWGRSGGAIFLLADQPQVTPTILHALVEKHASTLAPIVAPMVLDQRANPVLFDRVTFPDLMKLEGDVGGRGIFSKHKVSYLPWHDDAMLLDVDTPEHYQRLKDLLE